MDNKKLFTTACLRHGLSLLLARNLWGEATEAERLAVAATHDTDGVRAAVTAATAAVRQREAAAKATSELTDDETDE